MFVSFGSNANIDMQNPQINMSGILVLAAFGSVMFIIGGILLVIGVIAINLSLSIVIAGVTSSWLDVKNEEEKALIKTTQIMMFVLTAKHILQRMLSFAQIVASQPFELFPALIVTLKTQLKTNIV